MFNGCVARAKRVVPRDHVWSCACIPGSCDGVGSRDIESTERSHEWSGDAFPQSRACFSGSRGFPSLHYLAIASLEGRVLRTWVYRAYVFWVLGCRALRSRQYPLFRTHCACNVINPRFVELG